MIISQQAYASLHAFLLTLATVSAYNALMGYLAARLYKRRTRGQR